VYGHPSAKNRRPDWNDKRAKGGVGGGGNPVPSPGKKKDTQQSVNFGEEASGGGKKLREKGAKPRLKSLWGRNERTNEKLRATRVFSRTG